MVNPAYQINITYNPPHVSGQDIVVIGGVTQSVNTYDDGYFVASMLQVKLYATGSTYTEALTNLLVVVDASPNPVNGPFNNTQTW